MMMAPPLLLFLLLSLSLLSILHISHLSFVTSDSLSDGISFSQSPSSSAATVIPAHLIPFSPLPPSPFTVTTTTSLLSPFPSSSLLTLSYLVTGPLSTLHIPLSSHPPQRIDNLSLTTCLESFFSIENEIFYWEFNFSPSGDWQIYYWESYRNGSHVEMSIDDIDVKWDLLSPDTAQLSVTIDIGKLPIPPNVLPTQQWNVGMTTILQDNAQENTYWALIHKGKKPDFHLRNSFIQMVPRE